MTSDFSQEEGEETRCRNVGICSFQWREWRKLVSTRGVNWQGIAAGLAGHTHTEDVSVGCRKRCSKGPQVVRCWHRACATRRGIVQTFWLEILVGTVPSCPNVKSVSQLVSQLVSLVNKVHPKYRQVGKTSQSTYIYLKSMRVECFDFKHICERAFSLHKIKKKSSQSFLFFIVLKSSRANLLTVVLRANILKCSHMRRFEGYHPYLLICREELNAVPFVEPSQVAVKLILHTRWYYCICMTCNNE